jgi:hypothetical protein
MTLPNGDRAQLGEKLERYCLNPEHAKGKDKAALFANRLEITLEKNEVLEEVLLAVAIHDEATLKKRDQYGDHYNIKFPMQTDVGESWVLICMDCCRWRGIP